MTAPPCSIKGCMTPAMMLLGFVEGGVAAMCAEHFVEAVGKLMQRLGKKVDAQ